MCAEVELKSSIRKAVFYLILLPTQVETVSLHGRWTSVPVIICSCDLKAKGTWTDFAMVYRSILVGLCFLQLSTLLTAPLISTWTWKRVNLAWPQKHHPIVWHDPLMSQEACFTKGNDLEPSQSRMKTAGLANTECFYGSRKLCDILGVCIIAKARSILKY